MGKEVGWQVCCLRIEAGPTSVLGFVAGRQAVGTGTGGAGARISDWFRMDGYVLCCSETSSDWVVACTDERLVEGAGWADGN